VTRGLVIGKFYPPHRGHKFLIDTALRQVDYLDVLICVHPDHSISGKLREQWLKEIHPLAHVRQVHDIGYDDDSERWANYTIQILGQAPDVIFSSEGYGDAYSRFLGCRHVLVDRERVHIPISARAIRSAPLRHWDFLEPCVRGHFAKRICVVGAESTGTTTLAQDLAKYYQTVWVPEYGREYCEGIEESGEDSWTHKWRNEEFVHIARTQQDREDLMACQSNRVLICDTNAFATSLWHERYLGARSREVEAIVAGGHCDLYLLTDCDIPFVQDGLRDGESIRQWMTDRFRNELEIRKWQWLIVSGSRDQRLVRATTTIDSILAEGR
jgi:HTH-type transcriptional regulator, transcriptional repressor of NAD biosynthesis genes